MYRYVSWIITIKLTCLFNHWKGTYKMHIILTKLQSLYTNSTRSVEITKLRLDKCQIIILTTRTHSKPAPLFVVWQRNSRELSYYWICMIQRSSAMHQISALCSILLRATTVQQYCKEWKAQGMKKECRNAKILSRSSPVFVHMILYPRIKLYIHQTQLYQ